MLAGVAEERIRENAALDRVITARVDALESVVCDVAGVVDNIGVISRLSDERIGTLSAIENVAAVVARNLVDQSVAGADEIADTTQFEVLHIERQLVGDRRDDRINAAKV